MKSCPECGTRYEDYVENCLADGEKLEPLEEESPAAVADPTPVPPPQAASSGPNLLWLALLPLLFLLVLAAFALAFLLVPSGAEDPNPVEPAPAVVEPAPVVEPVVEPNPPAPAVEPPPDPVVTLALVSTPKGAVVLENDMEVCRTPCNVSHPPEASFPRTFVLKHPKHQNGTLVVEDAGGPYLVELKPNRRTTRPSPRPDPVPTTPKPAPGSAPTLGRER